MIEVYVMDKIEGGIHKVGTDIHDCLYVDDNGAVRYYNLQNGDGSSGGYEFVPYDPTIDEQNPIDKMLSSLN